MAEARSWPWVSPAAATTDQAPPACPDPSSALLGTAPVWSRSDGAPTMVAPSSRKAMTSSSSSAGSGLPSGATMRPATRASIWASDRAWTAAAVRRAATSTSTLTTPAVTRNMTRARMSRVSAMVKVWIGGAKK